jgi:hypothetical protein
MFSSRKFCPNCRRVQDIDRIFDKEINKIKIKCAECGNVLGFEKKPVQKEHVEKRIDSFLDDEYLTEAHINNRVKGVVKKMLLDFSKDNLTVSKKIDRIINSTEKTLKKYTNDSDTISIFLKLSPDIKRKFIGQLI